MNSDDRTWVGLARPALIALILSLLLAASIAGNRAGGSLAQEGEATPATPATPGTPVAIDFDQLVSERPGEVLSGSCDEPGETIASLTSLESPEGEAQGQGAAIEAESSYTSIPIPLESLLSGQSSIALLLSAEANETIIACGEIGGVVGEDGSLVVKLSERNGSGFTGIAFLAPGDPGTTGASVFLAGQRTVAETRELIAAATPAALEPIPEPTPTAEPVQVVDLVLLEWMIDVPEEIRAGQVNFVVTNEGSQKHSLVVEGNGLVFELPAPLESGESSILSAQLPPGEYVVYCPVDEGEHREEGMEATFEVVP
ncbi:MAG TPA: hypothetical protein VHG52_09570 [Thermomicrobiales bacterium]|nr:hypothetical protein [Thermomicrobiales bacterium]